MQHGHPYFYVNEPKPNIDNNHNYVIEQTVQLLFEHCYN